MIHFGWNLAGSHVEFFRTCAALDSEDIFMWDSRTKIIATIPSRHHDFYGWYTLWLFNIAMENGPFIDDFPS